MFSETSQRSKPRDLAIEDLNVKMLMGGGGMSLINIGMRSWLQTDFNRSITVSLPVNH